MNWSDRENTAGGCSPQRRVRRGESACESGIEAGGHSPDADGVPTAGRGTRTLNSHNRGFECNGDVTPTITEETLSRCCLRFTQLEWVTLTWSADS